MIKTLSITAGVVIDSIYVQQHAIHHRLFPDRACIDNDLQILESPFPIDLIIFCAQMGWKFWMLWMVLRLFCVLCERCTTIWTQR